MRVIFLKHTNTKQAKKTTMHELNTYALSKGLPLCVAYQRESFIEPLKLILNKSCNNVCSNKRRTYYRILCILKGAEISFSIPSFVTIHCVQMDAVKNKLFLDILAFPESNCELVLGVFYEYRFMFNVSPSDELLLKI